MVHSVLLDQAAELLGVSRRTVYYRIHEGRLQTIRTRCGSQRVLVESIERLLLEMRGSCCRRRSAAIAHVEVPVDFPIGTITDRGAGV